MYNAVDKETLLEMLRLEIRRSFEDVSVSSLGFLSRRVIWASLNLEGKAPCEMERLARVAIISEKTKWQDLSSVDWIKFIDEDLDEQEVMSFRTSALMTGGN